MLTETRDRWIGEQTIVSQSILATLIPPAAILHGAMQFRPDISVHAGTAPKERNPQIMKLRVYIGQQAYQPIVPHREISPVCGETPPDFYYPLNVRT